MKKITRFAIIGFLASFVLSACSLFGVNDENTRCYLHEQYVPVKEDACSFRDKEKMGGNTYKYVCAFDNYNGFPNGGIGCSVDLTYQISKGTYKSLCFVVGAIDLNLNNASSCSIELQVYLDGALKYDEMVFNYRDVNYVSLDISDVEEIRFFVNNKYSIKSNFAIGEACLFEKANASIEPTFNKATKEENFFSNVKHVYHNSNQVYDLEIDGKSATVEGVTYRQGLGFSPVNPISDTSIFNGYNLTYNAEGKYKYLHFQIGHVDNSKYNGSVLVFITVDGQRLEEIHISDSDLTKNISVDINYGHFVVFETFQDLSVEEEQIQVGSVGSYAIFNAVGSPNGNHPNDSDSNNNHFDGSYKLISEVGLPYNFVNAYSRDDSLFDGTSKYIGTRMNGVIYNEGMLLKTIWEMKTSTYEMIPARADFNLNGHFKYLTFVAGRRDRTMIVSDKLNVYVDDKLVNTWVLNSIAEVKSYQVNVDYGKKLTIELAGGASPIYRASFGIFDLAVHTETIGTVNFIHVADDKKAAKDNYPNNTTLQLMKDIVAYDSFSGANQEDILSEDRRYTSEYTYMDGRHFNANNQQHDIGFILQTGKYTGIVDDGSSIISMIFINAFFLLTDVKCSSFAAFNLRGQFKQLNFSVSSIDGYGAGMKKHLVILGDGNIIKEANITSGQESNIQTNVTGVSNLVFFLEYGEDGATDSTIPFGFYNLKVSN